MNTNKKHFGVRTFALVILIGALLFGGVGITGVAAQSSIPGDALYSVKTTIEQARLVLARDAGDRSVIKISLAEQRLEEIKLLISEGRFGEVSQAVLAFETNINGAILEIDTVAKVDPTRAASLAMKVVSALTRYAQVLTELAAIAPDSVKGELARALDTTQVASGLQMPSADDNSNGNSNNNANDDNSNSNGNANDDNSNDDNSNGNANDDNGNDDNSNDDNGNANDDNSNDDNSNGNANDDNSNDDNSNGNANDDNGNDDNGNDDNGNDDNGNDDNGNDDNGNDDNGNDDDSKSNDDNSYDDNGKGKGGGKDD